LAEIRIVNLLKVFGSLHAVDNLNYTFSDGKVTCLLGPSGCGKTTLLRMIAGLESITDGEIYFGEREITNLSTRERNIGMVFQYPVVYKGLTVEQNIALPLKEARMDTDESTRA
jgi:ABC-type sugar transport system ATPase subunit